MSRDGSLSRCLACAWQPSLIRPHSETLCASAWEKLSAHPLPAGGDVNSGRTVAAAANQKKFLIKDGEGRNCVSAGPIIGC